MKFMVKWSFWLEDRFDQHGNKTETVLRTYGSSGGGYGPGGLRCMWPSADLIDGGTVANQRGRLFELPPGKYRLDDIIKDYSCTK